ncbi:MAG: hypothetical protein HY814_08140 [Candidatus Riflebacteria bacterium]|nr:hypothetical protein [Candidatus Riflebacteria bacterium]
MRPASLPALTRRQPGQPQLPQNGCYRWALTWLGLAVLLSVALPCPAAGEEADLAPPAVVAVTFTRGLEGLPAGTWAATVDYSEPVGTTPALTWSAGTSTLTVSGPVRVSETRFVFDVVVVGGATEPAFGDPFVTPLGGAVFCGQSCGG